LETDIEIDDEFVRRIKEEVEEAVTKELCDPASAKTILSQVDGIDPEARCEERKAAITKILLASTWTQRLYFDIRSAMMALMSGATTFIVIWYFATINLIQALLLGIFVFVFSLVISRLFDAAITRAAKKIVRYLSKHKRLRTFILKNF
jgi:acetoacetate decarboxylase